LANAYLDRGWTVVATVRDPASLGDRTDDGLTIETVDTTDWPALDALRERLAGQSFDLLLVNAGIMLEADAGIGDGSPDAFGQMMLVNTLAPLRIADRFAELVTGKGIVAVMSSGLGSIMLNEAGGYEAYRTSKAALNMGLRSIAARKDDGRTWLAVDPGWVKTDLGGANADLTVDQSVSGLVDMFERRQGTGGVAFVSYENKELPW